MMENYTRFAQLSSYLYRKFALQVIELLLLLLLFYFFYLYKTLFIDLKKK